MGMHARVSFTRAYEHFANVDDYILFKQGLDAWTWSVNDMTTEGCFTRARPRPPAPARARPRRT